MSAISRMSLLRAKALNSKSGEFTFLRQCSYSFYKNKNELAPENEIRKSVFISQSTDIFTNLALEDWIYRHYDLSKHHILLLWKSDPCVVIGRHQNPWVECNVPAIDQTDILLARRNSGGGTVYHDAGNLNLSFFTPRERYNRQYNLGIITRALYREWGIKSQVNEKDDIIVQDEFKISGTAAKLGRPNAYHHCTLLVNTNKYNLSLALKKTETEITTNATESVRSPVKNLVEVNNHVTINKLIDAVGWEFLRTQALSLEDGGRKLIQQQKGFQMLNPSDGWFPGIEELAETFRSWNWVYGRTPDFTVTRMLEAPAAEGQNHLLKLMIEVKKGVVDNVKMTLPSDLNKDANVITNLRGKCYNHEIIERIVEATGCKVVAPDATAESNVAAI